MYTPPAFRDTDIEHIRATIRGAGLANLVTATRNGPVVTPLPLLLDEAEGEHGTLYGHLAKGNDHWEQEALGESIAIFMGPDAYITPSWYATKRESGKVVPTWNYVTVHAHGRIEFFEDAGRLLVAVTRLTRRHEDGRAHAWEVSDAPPAYIESQLKGIIGLRMPITRLEAKTKMSQNRSKDDRAGVAAGLETSGDPREKLSASLVRSQISD